MPASDIDAAAADSLIALDPNRPIREGDIVGVKLATGTIAKLARKGLFLSVIAVTRMLSHATC